MLRRKRSTGQRSAAPPEGQKQTKARKSAVAELEAAVLGHGEDALDVVLGQSALEKDGAHTARGEDSQPSKPLWQDEDDERLNVDVSSKAILRKLRDTEQDTVISGDSYGQKLRTQFTKIHGLPDWAQAATADVLASDSSSLSSTPLLQTSSRMVAKRSKRLPASVLDISPVTHANQAAISKSTVRAVQFHPTSNALLTAGMDKCLRLFHIDGKENPLLQSTMIDKLPISSAAFTPSGDEVFMSGRRPFFYTFDLATATTHRIAQLQGKPAEKSLEAMWMCPDDKHVVFAGHNGCLMLVDRKSKHWVADLKMNSKARNVAFSNDGSLMLSSGDDNRIYVWDLASRTCVHAFNDEGCLRSSALAVSPDGQHVATGSDSGVVNIYNSDCLKQEDPTPLKAIMNLTTRISNLTFNHDGQMLAMGSCEVKHAVRMVHMSSLSVFSNWPSQSKSHPDIQFKDCLQSLCFRISIELQPFVCILTEWRLLRIGHR
eukprot:TRINITY_DN10286_c0_g1_i2.p1 TRINITY_DN10286_c0_g1~~TRINITY_DN10286_c0_g1_i2.p1  ORF type:complete len:488 (+),score=77.79 TRINITY_DN10286_c0_g1_i2:82-1545(+)